MKTANQAQDYTLTIGQCETDRGLGARQRTLMKWRVVAVESLNRAFIAGPHALDPKHRLPLAAVNAETGAL
jgi:hypothetical protein